MIRIVHYDGKRVRTDLTSDDLPDLLKDLQGVLWVDLVETPVAEARPLLEQTFGFHPLAVDDALEETHIPKVDDWGDYLYLTMYGIRADWTQEDLVELPELDCFLTPNCMVTYEVRAASAMDRLWQTVQADPRAFSQGAPHLLYQLLDGLVIDYMAILEELDDRVETVEDTIFLQPSEKLLGEIFNYRRVLLQLRRSLAPQREVMNKLSRGTVSVVERDYGVYFRDIYDHMVRLYDITDTMRDVVSGTLEMYLSVVNNRMNDVMKTLTVITTLFMPLTFLTGFFGMNFFQVTFPLAAWTGPVAFGLMLLAMILVPVVMYVWMHRRSWL